MGKLHVKSYNPRFSKLYNHKFRIWVDGEIKGFGNRISLTSMTDISYDADEIKDEILMELYDWREEHEYGVQILSSKEITLEEAKLTESIYEVNYGGDIHKFIGDDWRSKFEL